MNPTPGSYEIKVKGVGISDCILCVDNSSVWMAWNRGNLGDGAFGTWARATNDFNGQFKLAQHSYWQGNDPCKWEFDSGQLQHAVAKSTAIQPGQGCQGGTRSILYSLTYRMLLTRTSATAGRLKIWIDAQNYSTYGTEQWVFWESDVAFPEDCEGLPGVGANEAAALVPGCSGQLFGTVGMAVEIVRVCAQQVACVEPDLVWTMHLDPPPAPLIQASNCGCSDCYSMCVEPGIAVTLHSADGSYIFSGTFTESNNYSISEGGHTVSVVSGDSTTIYVDGVAISQWIFTNSGPNGSTVAELVEVFSSAYVVDSLDLDPDASRPDWDGRVELYGGCCCNHHVYCVDGREIHVSVEIWPGTTGGILYASIRIWCANDHRVGEQGCVYGEPILLWYGRKYWSETEPNTNHVGTYEKYAGCLDINQWVLE